MGVWHPDRASNRTFSIQKYVQHSRTAAVYADHSEQRDRREIAPRKDSIHTTSSAEIRTLYPSSGIQTFDGQHSWPQLPKMWPGTTDVGTLARLPWHSTSTTGNFRYHWSTSSVHALNCSAVKSVALVRRSLWRLGAHAINNNNSSSSNCSINAGDECHESHQNLDWGTLLQTINCPTHTSSYLNRISGTVACITMQYSNRKRICYFIWYFAACVLRFFGSSPFPKPRARIRQVNHAWARCQTYGYLPSRLLTVTKS